MKLTLAGTPYLVDDTLADALQALSPKGWQVNNGYLGFQPRVADVQRHPLLKANRIVSAAALIHLLTTGTLPAKGTVASYQNGAEDLRFASLKFGTRAEMARKNFSTDFDPEAGVDLLPNGRYSARIYVPGRGVVRLRGSHATREEAQAARLEAYEDAKAHPEKYAKAPKAAPAPEERTTLEALREDLDAALAQIAALQAKVEAMQAVPF